MMVAFATRLPRPCRFLRAGVAIRVKALRAPRAKHAQLVYVALDGDGGNFLDDLALLKLGNEADAIMDKIEAEIAALSGGAFTRHDLESWGEMMAEDGPEIAFGADGRLMVVLADGGRFSAFSEARS